MWGESFRYETDESRAYTMWFFGENPNNATAATLGVPEPQTCGFDGTFHRTTPHDALPPSAESSDFTECHPWQDRTCCHEATVLSPSALNLGYGTCVIHRIEFRSVLVLLRTRGLPLRRLFQRKNTRFSADRQARATAGTAAVR